MIGEARSSPSVVPANDAATPLAALPRQTLGCSLRTVLLAPASGPRFAMRGGTPAEHEGEICVTGPT